MIGAFAGTQLVASPLLQEFQLVRVRQHALGKNSERYHRRIQKKWDKRFGFVEKRVWYEMPGCIMAHPNTIKLLLDRAGKLGATELESR